MGWGWIDRSARCWGIAGSKILVDLVSDCLQLTLLELADLEPAPALGRTDECAYISFKTARHAGSPWCAAVPRRTAARADWWCGLLDDGQEGNADVRCTPRSRRRDRRRPTVARGRRLLRCRRAADGQAPARPPDSRPHCGP